MTEIAAFVAGVLVAVAMFMEAGETTGAHHWINITLGVCGILVAILAVVFAFLKMTD